MMSDEELWKFAMEHALTIMLDNDETYVKDGEDWIAFNEYIGDGPGIPLLLDMLGLTSERV